MMKIFPKQNLGDIIQLNSHVSKVLNNLVKVNVTDPTLTLFHLAAKHGSLSICQLIIASIVGKHPRNFKSQTPLHYAAESGHLSICQLIIEKTKENNPQDVEYNIPLHMAAKNGHLSVCELFTGWIENAHANAYPANIQNSHGFSPLHLAAGNGHLSVCQFLVGKAANINQQNLSGICKE